MNRKRVWLPAAAAILLALLCSCDMDPENSAIKDFSKSNVAGKTQQALIISSADFSFGENANDEPIAASAHGLEFRVNTNDKNYQTNPPVNIEMDGRFIMPLKRDGLGGDQYLGSTGTHASRLESRTLDRQTPRRRSDAAVAAPKVLFDLSHSPHSAITPLIWYFSDFIATFELYGFEVSILADFQNLMNYNVVVEEMPQGSFTAADVNLIETFLDAGKIFLLFGDFGGWFTGAPPNWNPEVNALLANLTTGVQIIDTVVCEPQPGMYYISVDQPIIHDFSDHCLNDGVTEILHLDTSYLACDNPDQVLYRSSAYSYPWDTPAQLGPFPIAAIPDPTTHPNWKMFIAGDSNLFSTGSIINVFDFPGNVQFAVNLMFWCQSPPTTTTSTSTTTSTQPPITTTTSVTTTRPPTTSTTFATTSSTTTSTAPTDDDTAGDDSVDDDMSADDDQDDDDIISTQTPVPDVPTSDNGSDEEWPKGKITGGCCGC